MPKSSENFEQEQPRLDPMFSETLKKTVGKDTTLYVMKVLERNTSLFELNSPDRVKEQHQILFPFKKFRTSTVNGII